MKINRISINLVAPEQWSIVVDFSDNSVAFGDKLFDSPAEAFDWAQELEKEFLLAAA